MSDVRAVWGDLLADDCPKNWAVWDVKGCRNQRKKRPRLEVASTGAGGLADAMTLVDDNKVQVLGFRVTAVEKEKVGTVGGVRSKFCTIFWIA